MSKITPGCDFPSGEYPTRPEVWTMWGVANKHGVTMREILSKSRHPTISRARECVARALYNEHNYSTTSLATAMRRSESYGQEWTAKFRKENETLNMRGMLRS